MQLNITLVPIVISIAIILGLFICVLILAIKKENKLPNVILALFLLTIIVSISGAAAYVTKIFQQIPHLIGLNEPFRFLIAPFFYFYIITLTTGRLKFSLRLMLHFIPFIANIIFLLPFYMKPAGLKIQFIMANCLTDQMPFISNNYIYFILITVQLVFYVFLVKKELKIYEKTSKDNFSSIDKINLSWLNYFVSVVIAFCVLLVFVILLWPLRNHFFVLVHPFPVFLSLMVIMLVFRALRQPAVLNDLSINERDSAKKYELSTLTTEDAQKYYKRLLEYMEKEKPYLQPELSLQQLADDLQVPVRHLSQVINEKTGMSFFNYINSYRIEEIKKYLSDNMYGKETVISLAFNSGFNSKPTFNAVFKKATGLTPQQFRKNHLNNNSK